MSRAVPGRLTHSSRKQRPLANRRGKALVTLGCVVTSEHSVSGGIRKKTSVRPDTNRTTYPGRRSDVPAFRFSGKTAHALWFGVAYALPYLWQTRSVLLARSNPIERNQLHRCVLELPQVADRISPPASRVFSHLVRTLSKRKKSRGFAPAALLPDLSRQPFSCSCGTAKFEASGGSAQLTGQATQDPVLDVCATTVLFPSGPLISCPVRGRR